MSTAKAAQLPAPGADDVFYVVDLSGYVFRAYHAITPLSNSKGEPTHAVLGTVNMLQRVFNGRRPSWLAIAMDSRGPSVRKELDARYKATRAPAPPDLYQQMDRCRQIIELYRAQTFESPGYEADDLIAALTVRAVKEGLRVVIVSADKDLMQLVHDDDDSVLLWDSMRDRVFGPREVFEKWGVPPSKLRDLLALTGDTSDNIPGVPGVGPKTAADLLGRFGTLDAIYAHVDELKNGKVKDNLIAHEADARLSQDLVTLREELPLDWNPAALKWPGGDIDGLRALFTDLEFSRLLDDRAEFRAPSRPVPATGGAQLALAAGKQTSASIRRSSALVLDALHLERIVTRARDSRRLAITAVGSSDEAMRSALVGISLATDVGEAHYLPLSHRYLGAPSMLSLEQVKALVGPVLADSAIEKTSYELKRTEVLLGRFGFVFEGKARDPLLMSYLLDPEAPNALVELARRELDVALPVYVEKASAKAARVPFDELDVEAALSFGAPLAALALELADRFGTRLAHDGMSSLLEDVEMPLSRVLARMESTGVRVDTDVLASLEREAIQMLTRLEAEAKAIVGHEFSIRSRDQLEAILFDELKLPVVKRTPKGGRSTDAAVLEELADAHALPRVIVDYREVDKLKGTYLEALPRAKNETTGRVHTRFDQAVAATGRLSSNSPNLQNIPIRTEFGRKIREAFVPPDGAVLMSADYSQIELRVLAHLSKDPHFVEAFKTGGDIHVHTAARIFDVPREQVTQEMRRRAKTINFGVIYGMGDSALARQLGIARDEAARFIAAYFTRYEGVKAFMDGTVEVAKKGEAVRTLLGRRRFLPNLHSTNRGLRFEAERVAKNTPIQGTAADILKLAMVRLGEHPPVPGARLVLTVHDELVFEIPVGREADAAQAIREAMETVVALDVPLVVDVGYGPNWNAAH